MAGRRALILGGTGAIGAAVCRRLVGLGWEVVATGRRASTGAVALPARAVDLDLESDDAPAGLLADVAAGSLQLVVDALGEFSALPLVAPPDDVRRLVWVNSFGRARVLFPLIGALAPGSAVVRVESSLGERPLDSAPVVSAAKAADGALSVLLARACRQRGIGFGAFVLGAARESLAPAEQAQFVAGTGAPPPTLDEVASAVCRLGEITSDSGVDLRMWFPDVVRCVDVTTQPRPSGVTAPPPANRENPAHPPPSREPLVQYRSLDGSC